MKHLLPFKTAVLAKEVGVIFPVRYFYPEWDDVGDENPLDSFEECAFPIDAKTMLMYGDVVGVPTLDEMNTHLRDNYNIKIDVSSCTRNRKGEWKDWSVSVNNKQIVDHRDGKDSQEEGMAAGIEYALDCIKLKIKL